MPGEPGPVGPPGPPGNELMVKLKMTNAITTEKKQTFLYVIIFLLCDLGFPGPAGMPGPQEIKGNRGDTGGAGQISFIVLLYVSSISEVEGRSYSQKYFFNFTDSP